ncbi:hypothetical protein AB0D91_28190 [Streptomyces canus]|uniref:hypothetical protein n=1 Tax=Streptomyces canus TaxID=58343 RepID=UPI0033C1CB2B
MRVDNTRRAGNDHQHVGDADRRLLDNAALPADGIGEQLAPLLVAESGAATSSVPMSTEVLPTKTWYVGQEIIASKIRLTPLESFAAESLYSSSATSESLPPV